MAAIRYTGSGAGSVSNIVSGTAARTDAVGRTLIQAVLAALEAPSILNTQPWRWRIDHDTAQLRADRTRQLRAIDPDGRLLTLCCGASLHHARVAFAADGVDVSVTHLPTGGDTDLLATVRFTGRTEPAAQAQRLRRAISQWRIDRRPFADDPVPDRALDALRRAAQQAGANLHVARPQDLSAITVAGGHAANVEQSDPRYVAEMAAWFRTAQVPPETAATASGPRLVPLRDLTGEGDASIYSGLDVADRNARYAIVVTDGDSARDWLTAGEAMSAVLLTATAERLATSIMSELVEIVAARTTLRRMLGNVGYPAMVLRVGVAGRDGTAPRAPLRPTADVIEVVTDPA